MRVVNLLDWNISTRLWIGYGILVLALAIVIAVSSTIIVKSNNELETIAEDQLTLQQSIHAVKRDADIIARSVSKYQTNQDSLSLDKARKAESSLSTNMKDFLSSAHVIDLASYSDELNQLSDGIIDAYYRLFVYLNDQSEDLAAFREDVESVDNVIHKNLLGSIDSADSEADVKTEGAMGMALCLRRLFIAVEECTYGCSSDAPETIDEIYADFYSYHQKYLSTVISEYEQSWLSKIADDFASVAEEGVELVALSGTVQALNGQFLNDYDKLTSVITNDIEPAIQSKIDDSLDSARDTIDQSIILLIVSAVLGIVAGGTVSAFTSKRFHKSVKGLQYGSNAIASGKTDYRFDVDTKDEFGNIGFSLNQMLHNLGRSRNALGESEETAWALLDATADSVILIDTRGTILASNEIAADRFGKSLEQMIDENYYDLLPEDIMPSRKAQILEVIRTGKPSSYEYERDGMMYDQRIFPVIDHKSGQVKRLALFSHDITTRKWVEEVSERLRRRNELILEAAGEGIFGLDVQGRTTFVNPAAAHMLGYKPNELIGERHHELVHHSKPDGMPYPSQACPIYAAFNDGAVRMSVDNEVFWRRDGTSFPVEYTSTPIIEDGKIAGAVVTFRDISERKLVETALRRTAERYRTIMDGASTLILYVDRNGIIVDANLQTEEILGRSPDEIIGQPFNEYVLVNHQPKVDTALRELMTKGFYYGIRFKMIRSDYNAITVNMNAAAIKDENGTYIRTICMIDEVASSAS